MLRDEIAFLGRAGGHILVLGPSGVGKELAARALHELSDRAKGPFVARNAATLPSALVDAELFGHARNYPNAPMPERAGLLGETDGGTLFLDEIGELPSELQAHLLRVLDAGGEYHRLGESHPRRADVRLVAATNREEASLKRDFAARFTLRLRVPGLDARPEDVPLLVRHVLRRAAARDRSLGPRFFEGWGTDASEPRIDPLLLDGLLHHPYTHHVRELESLLWEAMAKSPGSFVASTPEFEQRLAESAPKRLVRPEELTRERIEEALAACGGSQERAYRHLGLKNRDVLYRVMKKLGIQYRRD